MVFALGWGFEHDVETDPLGMLEALVRGHREGLGLNRDQVDLGNMEGLNRRRQVVDNYGHELSKVVPHINMFGDSRVGSDRMLHSESRLLPKGSKEPGKSPKKSADPKRIQPRRGAPIRIRVQRRGPAQSRSLKAAPTPFQSLAEREAVSKTKAVNKWNWKPIDSKQHPKKEVDQTLLEAARDRLDSLTAPKVKIVHKKKKEVVVMTKAPDPEEEDFQRSRPQNLSTPVQKKSLNDEVKNLESSKANRSPPKKIAQTAKKRFVTKKLRGRQPKRERFEHLKVQRESPETAKMPSSRGRSPQERRATPVARWRSSAQARTANIELPQQKSDNEIPVGKGGDSSESDSTGFSSFDIDFSDGFADFGPAFDFPRIDSSSGAPLQKKEPLQKKKEPAIESGDKKVLPKREIPSYSAALKEHTYRLKDYKVPKKASKATKGSNLYVTDPLKNVELEKIVPDPRPYIDEQAPVPVKATNAYDFGFDGGFGDDFNSGFTDFKPDHAYQSYGVDEVHKFEPLKPEPYHEDIYVPKPLKQEPYQEPYKENIYLPKPLKQEPYKEDIFVPKPYTPKLYKPVLPKATLHAASPQKLEMGAKYQVPSAKYQVGAKYHYQAPHFRPPVHAKPYNKKSHEVVKVEHFEPKPQSFHDSSYEEPSGFHAPPSSPSFHESSKFQELNPFQSTPTFLAEPFLQPETFPEPFLQAETFPESESFFSQQLHSTESYHQSDPIVHSVETFHQPSTNFFGEPSPQESPIQRGRAGHQPSFRSDPLESFPSFSGPSFDTFLLEDAGERPAREIEQPAFSSFNPPPSSPVEKRSRQGAGR